MKRSKLTTLQIIALRQAGKSVEEIAQMAGIARSSVYLRLHAHEREQAWEPPVLAQPTLTIDEHATPSVSAARGASSTRPMPRATSGSSSRGANVPGMAVAATGSARQLPGELPHRARRLSVLRYQRSVGGMGSSYERRPTPWRQP
jgi:hypothetical protein